MKDLKNKIRQMLREKKIHNRAVALVTALSMITMMTVPEIGTALNRNVPDAAAPISPLITSAEDGTVRIDDAGWIDGEWTAVTGLNINSYVDKLYLSTTPPTQGNKGTPYTEPNVDFPVDDGASTSLYISMDYSIPRDVLEEKGILTDPTVGTPEHFLQFELDDTDFTISNSMWGSSKVVYDGSEGAPSPAGYYSLSKDTGLLTVRLTDDYLAYLRNNNSGCQGSLMIGGSVLKGEDEEADRSVTVAGFEVNVNFPNRIPELEKSKVSSTSNSITWEIKIKNPDGVIDMSVASIIDVLTKATGETVAWNAENIEIDTGVSTSGVTLTDTGFHIPESAKNDPVITIRYTQKNAEQNVEYTNAAKIKRDGKDDIEQKNPATHTIENKLSVTKSGAPDYATGKPDNKIHWVIRVSNDFGYPLNDVTVDDIDFDFTDTNIVSITDDTGAAITNYTIENGNIVFGPDVNFQNAKISFDTPVDPAAAKSEEGYTVTNKVKATSDATVNKPEPSDEVPSAPVTYKYQFQFEKSVGGTSSNSMEKVQWKIAAIADYGSNSKANLDGYVIQDEAFIGKTMGTDITYNAWSRNTQVEAKNYLTFDGPDSQGRITVHVSDDEPVYEINFFVDQEYADATYSQGSYEEYKAGGQVVMTNTAKGENTDLGVSGESTIGYTTQMKDEVTSKTYTGEDKSLNVMGNPEGEETTKPLTWEVVAQREGGIDATVTVTDVLVETVAGSHYITPEQAAATGWLTVVKSANASFTEATPVDAASYDVLFYETESSTTPIENFTSQSAKNAAKIEVKFKDDIDANYVKLAYSSTADLSKVQKGTTGQYNNKAKTKGDYKTATGLTFSRDDPSQVKYFKFVLKKHWADAMNAKGNRPTNLMFVVKRTTGDPATTENWESVGTYTVNANATYGAEDFQFRDNNNEISFPQWDVTGTRYYYKVDEVLPDDSGYVVKSQDEPFLAEFANGASKTYNIENAPESSLKKLAIDAGGSEKQELKYSQIPKVTINGTEYYMFRWKVEAIVPKFSPAVHFYETLPDDVIFVGPDIVNTYGLNNSGGNYYPTKKFSWGEQQWYGGVSGDLSYAKDGNQITITVDAGFKDDLEYFTYYTAVPVSKYPDLVEGGTVIENTITDEEDNTSTASLTVKADEEPEPEEPEGPSAVTKSYIKADQRGTISYRLDVNPDGDDIAAGDTIQITDKLSVESSDPSLSGVEVSLSSIQVHRYVTGQKSDPVITSFDYLQKSNGREDKEYTVTPGTANFNGGTKNIWDIGGWEVGDQITLDIETTDGNNPDCQVVFSRVENSNDFNNVTKSENVKSKQVTYEIPKDTKRIFIMDRPYWGDSTISTVIASGKSTPYASLMDIEVPDEEHVWVEYTYDVTGYPTYKIEQGHSTNNKVQYWKITGFMGKDNIAAMLTRLSGVSARDGDVKYWIKNYAPGIGETLNDYNNNDWKSFTDDPTFENERITVTAGEWDNALYIVDLGKLVDESNQFALETVDAAPSILFTNSASYKEANGSGNDTSSGNEMQVSYSNMSITVTKYPEIYKTDIGSDSINTLAAKFKVAKYVKNVGWVYASACQTVTKGNKKARKLIFPTAAEGYTEVGHTTAAGELTYPENAFTLEFDDTDSTSDHSIHNFILDEKEVYKFVEIVAPEGYLQPDWGKGGLTTNKDFVFCYAYGGAVKSEYPQEIQSQLKTWTKDSKLNIQNSSRISIGAKKEFSGTQPPEVSDVTLALYSATNSEGKNKTLVDEAFLEMTEEEKTAYQDTNGKPFTFTNPVVLHYDVSDVENPVNTVGWEQLPSGKDGNVLYYFVVEQSYTLTENQVTKTYKLDETDGKYYEYDTSTNSFVENGGNRNVGKYRPISDTKGTKTNGSVIEINNSEGILIRKIWRDSDKNEVEPPAESGSPEGKMQIPFKVTGKLHGYDVVLDLGGDNMLSAGSYQTLLPDSVSIAAPTDQDVIDAIGYTIGKTYQLREFTSFTVEEDLTDNAKKTLLTNAGFSLDDIKVSGSARDGFGVFEIINTKQATVKFYVKKKWKTNDSNYTNETLSFTLYESSNGTTWTKTNTATPTPTKNAATKEWVYEYSGLDPDKYYKVEEEDPPLGYEVKYLTTQSGGKQCGNESDPYIVENVAAQKMKLEKVWTQETPNDTWVKLGVYRSSDPTAAAKLQQSLKAPSLNVTAPTGGTLTLTKGQMGTITVDNAPASYFITHSGIADITKSDTTFTVQGTKAGSTQLIMTYPADGVDKTDVVVTIVVKEPASGTQSTNNAPNSTNSLSPRFSSKNAPLRLGAAPETEYALTVDEISATKPYLVTLNSENSYQFELDVPAYDSSGSLYYYWVQELEVGQGEDEGVVPTTQYTVQYQYSDSDAVTAVTDTDVNGIGTVFVKVYNTGKDYQVTLPETGGRGTKIYYTIGGMLLMLGAVGYVTIRRRRWSNE